LLYQNEISEKNSSSCFEEPHGNNGHGEIPGDGASRINEDNLSILVSNNNGSGRSLGDGQDGPEPKKRSLQRLNGRQEEILEGYGS